MRDRLSALIGALAASTTALGNGAIRRVTLAFFTYNTVEIGAWTAILIYAYEATGPASVGVVAVVQLVPSALAAPFLAGFGDRYPRHRVLVGWYAVQAMAIGAIGLAILLALPPLVVYAISTSATIALTQTRPVQAALLPEVADTPDELTASNALASIGEGVGAFAGPLGVGALLTVTSLGSTFIAGGALLLVGAFVLGGVRGRPAVPPVADDMAGRGDEPYAHPAAVLAGLREVARDADLVVVMALLTGRLVIFGGLEVLVVLLALDLLGMGDAGAGFLLAALGIGTIAGAGAAFALVGRQRLAPWLGVGAVIIGLPIALIAVAPASSTTALLLALCGVGLAVLDVAGQTLLQRITPDAVRARVFGVLEGLLLLGEALGSVIIGPLALLLGLQGTAVVLGLLLPILAALAVARFARIDGRVVVPATELAVLRRVPMFAPLAPSALESLARHLVPLSAAGGDVVIREGEPGDRWYIVGDGRLEVTAGGLAIRALGPGDTFGEIALLHDVRRTATVTSITRSSLWALEREEFLASVTRMPSAFAEAQRLAAERVAGAGRAAAPGVAPDGAGAG